jgi:hypothetical protein
VDFNVEPCQKGDCKLQNIFDEDGVRQPHKLTRKNELWTFVWLANFVETCVYPIIVGISACSH